MYKGEVPGPKGLPSWHQRNECPGTRPRLTRKGRRTSKIAHLSVPKVSYNLSDILHSRPFQGSLAPDSHDSPPEPNSSSFHSKTQAVMGNYCLRICVTRVVPSFGLERGRRRPKLWRRARARITRVCADRSAKVLIRTTRVIRVLSSRHEKYGMTPDNLTMIFPSLLQSFLLCLTQRMISSTSPLRLVFSIRPSRSDRM